MHVPPPARALSRPTTPAEQALVARAVRSQRWAHTALVAFVGLAALMPLVIVGIMRPSAGDVAAAGVASAVVAAAAGALWVGYRRLARTVPHMPDVAMKLSGVYAVEAVAAGMYAGRLRPTVGGREVEPPAAWRSYLTPGTEAAVWAVETNRNPLVVAIEGGPSADGDAEIWAGHGDPPGTMDGPLFIAYVLIVQALLVVSWRAASGELPGWAWAVSGTLVVAGAIVLARASRSRDLLHEGYHGAGVRGARPLRERLARRWRRTAVLSGSAGVCSAAAVAFFLAFPATLAVAVGGVAALLGWASALAAEDSLSLLHGAHSS